jgi:hypothetical protein
LQILTTSPCKNAGTSITGNGGVDYWGHTLYSGLPDIGAHEFDGSAVPNNANLAMNKTVTASSSPENWGWSRAHLVDGSNNTTGNTNGWTSWGNEGSNHTEWVTIDLGASYTVNRVVMYPRNDAGYVAESFPRTFDIKVSTNNSTWTTVSSQSNYPLPGDAPQYFSFSNQTAQYINVAFTSLRQNASGGYSVCLAEMQVLNDTSTPPTASLPVGNYALSKDVKVSSSIETSGWFKTKVNDGQQGSVASTSMGWGSVSTTSDHLEWCTVNMGAVKSISKVDLYPRNDSPYVGEGFPVNLNIYVSTDNWTWTLVYSATGIPKPTGVRSCTFTATNAQYVSVQGPSLRALNGQYSMALAEIEIYP